MTHSVESARYAIYFAPQAGSPLADFGASCLGRDAASGEMKAQPEIDGLSADRWRAVTASPRRYGFHATLKAPFHLAEGRTHAALVDQLERFAGTQGPFDAPVLRIARIADFLALVLSAPSPEMMGLAEQAVCDFDAFRAPPYAEELARRLPASLTPRQRGLLSTWGYPFVLDEWRFHLTLATGLVNGEAERVRPRLEELSQPHCQSPLRVDAVCLFEQPGEDAPFRLTHRFPFRGRPE